jgi:hypothetical protein
MLPRPIPSAVDLDPPNHIVVHPIDPILAIKRDIDKMVRATVLNQKARQTSKKRDKPDRRCRACRACANERTIDMSQDSRSV